MEEFRDFDITAFAEFREIENQYSDTFIKENLCVKLRETDSAVTVCFGKDNPDCLENLKSFHHPKKVLVVKSEERDFVQFIGTVLEGNTKEESFNSFKSYHENLSVTEVEGTESVVNIVNGICISALRQNASDIHIHRLQDRVDIRFRIDGTLKSVQSFDGSIYETVISRIKVMAGLNIAEKRLPQDGRISAKFADDHFDCRVSIIPTSLGETVVMRLFGSKENELSLEELGFSDNMMTGLKKVGKMKSGLVVITGPTGSGKNTTLYALLKEMDRSSLKIISIEDPVERIIDGVDQIEINEVIGLTFSDVLRRVLRQDPDVIMVGEIRDDETATLAVRAALTGHLILATLHTEDSVAVITRLEDQGIKPYLIASTLKMAFAQRLLKRKKPLKKTGRIAVGEVFETDTQIKALIMEGRSENRVREYLKKKGFRSITEDASALSEKKLVAKEELVRESLA